MSWFQRVRGSCEPAPEPAEPVTRTIPRISEDPLDISASPHTGSTGVISEETSHIPSRDGGGRRRSQTSDASTQTATQEGITQLEHDGFSNVQGEDLGHGVAPERATDNLANGAQGRAAQMETSSVVGRGWKQKIIWAATFLFGLAKVLGPLKGILAAATVVYQRHKGVRAVSDKVEVLRSRIAALGILLEKPPADVSEQTRQIELLSKLEAIREKLWAFDRKPTLRRLADHVQDNEDISRLLENLQEAVNDYQMVRRPVSPVLIGLGILIFIGWIWGCCQTCRRRRPTTMLVKR